MHYYQLDSRDMDAAFLRGEAVVCRVVIRQKDPALDTVHEGQSIIIMLSNRAKYKAQIVRFTRALQAGDRIAGEMTVVRDTPPV